MLEFSRAEDQEWIVAYVNSNIAKFAGSIDSMPYTSAFEEMYDRFVLERGAITHNELWLMMESLRKRDRKHKIFPRMRHMTTTNFTTRERNGLAKCTASYLDGCGNDISKLPYTMEFDVLHSWFCEHYVERKHMPKNSFWRGLLNVRKAGKATVTSSKALVEALQQVNGRQTNGRDYCEGVRNTKYTINQLPVDALKIDTSYQREPSEKQVKRMAAAPDALKLDLPLIGRRSDGSLWIVDGQARVAMLRDIGVTAVLCRVFGSDGPEHEAKLYHELNDERRDLKAYHKHKARTRYGDAIACGVNDVLNRYGFSVEGAYCDGTIKLKCISKLRMAYEQGCLAFICCLMSGAWSQQPESRQASRKELLVSGIRVFMTHFMSNALKARLKTLVNTENAHALTDANVRIAEFGEQDEFRDRNSVICDLRHAKKRWLSVPATMFTMVADTGGGKYKACAMNLLEAYNRQLRSNRLEW